MINPVPLFMGDFSYGKLYTAKSKNKVPLVLKSVSSANDEIEKLIKTAKTGELIENSFLTHVGNTFVNLENNEPHVLQDSLAVIANSGSSINDLLTAVADVLYYQPARFYTQLYAAAVKKLKVHPFLFIKGYLVFNVYHADTYKLLINNAAYRTDAIEYTHLIPITEQSYEERRKGLLSSGVVGLSLAEEQEQDRLMGLRKEIFGY